MVLVYSRQYLPISTKILQSKNIDISQFSSRSHKHSHVLVLGFNLFLNRSNSMAKGNCQELNSYWHLVNQVLDQKEGTFLLYQLCVLMTVNATLTSVFIAKFFSETFVHKEQYVIQYTMNKLTIIQIDLTIALHS